MPKIKTQKRSWFRGICRIFFLHNNSLKYRKSINFNQAKFSEEKVYFNDFEREDLQNIYFKSDEEISKILAENSISVPVAGKRQKFQVRKN